MDNITTEKVPYSTYIANISNNEFLEGFNKQQKMAFILQNYGKYNEEYSIQDFLYEFRWEDCYNLNFHGWSLEKTDDKYGSLSVATYCKDSQKIMLINTSERANEGEANILAFSDSLQNLFMFLNDFNFKVPVFNPENYIAQQVVEPFLDF